MNRNQRMLERRSSGLFRIALASLLWMTVFQGAGAGMVMADDRPVAPSNVGSGWVAERVDLEVTIHPADETLSVTGTAMLRLAEPSEVGPALSINSEEAVMTFLSVEGDGVADVILNETHPLFPANRIARTVLEHPAKPGDAIELQFTYESAGRASQLVVRPNLAVGSWTDLWYPVAPAPPGELSLSGLASVPGRTTFHLPSGWHSLSEGRLTDTKVLPDGVIEIWETSVPIARSFAAGPYNVARHRVRDREIGVYLLSEKPTSAREQAEALAKAITAMEKRFGPFPYPSYGIAEVPPGLFSWYAASQQGFVMASSAAFSWEGGNLPLFAHEAAHAWWGNLVGTGGRGGILCSESLAQYGAVIAIEAVEGKEAATRFLRFSRAGYSATQSAKGYFKLREEGHDRPLSQLGSGGWQHNLSDAKGHWVYHMLRHEVGDDVFFGTLQDIVQDYAGKKLTLDDLRERFITAAPELDLETFFSQWYDRTGAPVLSANWQSVGDDQMDLTILQEQEGEPFHLDLEIQIETASPPVRHRVQVTEKTTRVRLEVPGTPRSVQIDPDHNLLVWTEDYGARMAALAYVDEAQGLLPPGDPDNRRGGAPASNSTRSGDGAVSTGSSVASTGSALVSDFEAGSPSVAIGFGWDVSTDQFLGGKSIAEFRVVEGGAEGSTGALLVTGHVEERVPPRWGGAMLFPGDGAMDPTDLSQHQTLRFWTVGDGGTYSVLLFTEVRGHNPSIMTFVAGAEWEEVRLPFSEFDGTDATDVMGVLFAAQEPGDFSFRIDNIRLE